MYSHIFERVFMFRPASLGSLCGKIPAWPNQRTIRFSKKKKSAIKLGDWDLKPGGFQNICQIKRRLNYQPLFRKMSPHSSLNLLKQVFKPNVQETEYTVREKNFKLQ